MLWVYFVKPIGMPGPIKIGCSAMPRHRLSQLNSWAAFPLEIICRIPGDYDAERRFHARLQADWSHSEWFHPTPDVLAVVESAKLGVIPDTSPKILRKRDEAVMKSRGERIGWRHRLEAAKRHAFGFAGWYARFPEEHALDASSDQRRPLTDEERAALWALIGRLKAVPKHALSKQEAWSKAGRPKPDATEIDLIASAKAA